MTKIEIDLPLEICNSSIPPNGIHRSLESRKQIKIKQSMNK